MDIKMGSTYPLEPLIRVRGKSSPRKLLLCQADRIVVMWSPFAVAVRLQGGAAASPPLSFAPLSLSSSCAHTHSLSFTPRVVLSQCALVLLAPGTLLIRVVVLMSLKMETP